MITVEHLQKNFKKTVKQPGLVASVKSLFKPDVEIFERSRTSALKCQKVKSLDLLVAMVLANQPRLKC